MYRKEVVSPPTSVRATPEPQTPQKEILSQETEEAPQEFTTVKQLVEESGRSESTILSRIKRVEEEKLGEVLRVVEKGRKRIYVGPKGRESILAMDRKRAELRDEDLLGGLEPSKTDAVTLYLKEVRKTPLLNAEEEVELAKHMEKGKEASLKLNSDGDFSSQDKDVLEKTILAGKLARKRFIKANARLVISMARCYIGRGLPFSDLIQEGNIGLMRAVDRFDYKRGFRFSTYATWGIRQAINRAIAYQGRTIRIPVHMVERLSKLSRVSRGLADQLGREPKPPEIAAEMDTTVEKIEELRKIGQRTLSLEKPVGEGDSELGHFIEDTQVFPPPDAAAQEILRGQLDEVLSSLTRREEEVLRRRFGLDGGEGQTLEEVGWEFGLTRERIRQIEAKALRKLRHPYRSRKLRDFLK